MISRHTVLCPGCNSRITLRLSVGLDKEQPFYFVCNRCKAATRGKLVIWYEPKPGARLELDEGREVEESKSSTQVITIHPDLPAKADAREMWDEGGSPFIMHHQLLGDRFQEFYQRLNTFRETSDQDWLKVRRWIGYYVNSQWEDFDSEGKRIFEEYWPSPEKEWMRHDFLHKTLDTLFAPIWVNSYYPDMKAEWCYLSGFPKGVPEALTKFAENSIRSGEIQEVQKEVFHCLDLFMENRSALLPGLAAEMYTRNKEESIQELRLFRDEFAQLRDLYVVTFETCHHVLKYVVGVINIEKRGDCDDFGLAQPKSIEAFEKLSNAKKAGFITDLAQWQKNWPLLLDRNLRNAISHHSVGHDLANGTLVLKDGKVIPYLEFVVKSLHLIHPILLAANVLKYMHIICTINK